MVAALGVADCPFLPRGTAGNVNVDIIRTGNEDVRGDAQALPFKDGSLDGIYAHHLLEHLRRETAPSVMQEWRRALKPGGFLSVVIPDWALLFAGIDCEEGLGFRDKILFGHDDARGPYQPHQSAWSMPEVAQLLHGAGFGYLQPIDPRTYNPLVARPRWQSGVYGVKG